jgi:spore coat protein U-like protein
MTPPTHRLTSVGILLVAGLAAVALLTPIANARQQEQTISETTANMAVSAMVIRKCTLSTQALSFGAYDPVQANATAPLDGQATLTVACTKGTSVYIGLDEGTNSLASLRRMAGDGREYLAYELYKNPMRTDAWTDSGFGLLNGGIAPSRDPRQFTVYGRVPGGQDVRVGRFQDTVLVTVLF